MIANVILKNWMSFKEETQFSLVARDFKERNKKIPRIDKYNTSILPLATIFGGNASGKSNFVEALIFTQRMVVAGTDNGQKISVTPFILDEKCKANPSEFTFELIIDNKLYEYGFSADREKVHWEKLILINEDETEKILFNRKGNKYNYGDSEKKKFKIVEETTRPNQLFLKNSVYLNLEDFKNVFEWFKNSILILGPRSQWIGPIRQLRDKKNPLRDHLQKLLYLLDTGVTGIDASNVPSPIIESYIKRGRISPDQIEEDTELSTIIDNNIYTFYRENGNIKGDQLVFLHQGANEKMIPLELGQESDGTIRLLDILPAFMYLTSKKSSNILIVDELDRSLHSMLNKNLIDFYLRTCTKNSRTQLICTTHDLYLLSRLNLRRDEIWVTNRDFVGITRLQSLGAYENIKEDNDIFELYESGLLGGIPRIMYESTSSSPLSTI